jgi:hypothetical protein
MIAEEKQNISIEQFRSILCWLARTRTPHFGIIGGEPTMHPHFDKIMEEVNRYCQEMDAGATLFTNGIHLDQWLPVIGNGVGILLNCNSDLNMKPEQWKAMNSTLDHLSLMGWFLPGRERCTVGCNLYAEREDYDYLWEIVDRLHLQQIRTSVTAPISNRWKRDKEGYYEKMKPIFLSFCRRAQERSVRLNIDCNHIPVCYYTPAERDLVAEVSEQVPDAMCVPVVDITPDFRATACFGAYDPVSCADFETLPDLERFLLFRKTYPRVQSNCSGKCNGCKQHDLLLCQGGCLAFADISGEG